MTDSVYRLLGCRGCGSLIVEAALRLAAIPYDYEEINYEQPGPQRDRLLALNPLGQVPTLVLPDGSIMTESAAIIMMIDDVAPDAGLVPPKGTEERNPSCDGWYSWSRRFIRPGPMATIRRSGCRDFRNRRSCAPPPTSTGRRSGPTLKAVLIRRLGFSATGSPRLTFTWAP
jgi:glutathione S-transferase